MRLIVITLVCVLLAVCFIEFQKRNDISTSHSYSELTKSSQDSISNTQNNISTDQPNTSKDTLNSKKNGRSPEDILRDITFCSVEIAAKEYFTSDDFEQFCDVELINNDERKVVAVEFQIGSQYSTPSFERFKTNLPKGKTKKFRIKFKNEYERSFYLRRAVFENGQTCQVLSRPSGLP